MKPKNFIWYTGIFTYPVLMLLFRLIASQVVHDFAIPSICIALFVYVLPLLVPAIITATNYGRQCRGQSDFCFSAVYGLGTKDEKRSRRYLDAAYPDIPAQYAAKIPKDIVLGTWKGKYAFCPVMKDGINGFVVGTPGSGKSVLLLGWLYSLFYRAEIAKAGHTKPGKKYNFALIDIKGELFEKLLCIKAEDYTAKEYPKLQVVQPSNHNSFGWDVFYRIHKENVSESECIKAVSDISDALIMASGDNPYFTDNAKKILSGVLYYYAKLGWDFLPIIQRLMRTSLDELLTQIVCDAAGQNMGVVLDKLQSFVGKGDNESIADVETTLKTYLEVFSYPDLQWALHDNPNKTSPAILDDGSTCFDLAIEESMLATYQPLFRLITMQILRHCESDFHEDDDRFTCLIFDEAARIGCIHGLDAAMSTLRSKHTSLLCLFQSLSQFQDIYPNEKAKTLLNLCELKLFLSGSGDKETTDLVAAMSGECEVVKMSYRHKGFFGGRSDGNYSPEKRPIVDAKAMMELREKGEAIAFVYGHYMRLHKLQYFKDPYLAPIVRKKLTDPKRRSNK